MNANASPFEIRNASAAEIPRIAELWCEAFPSSRTVEDRSRMLRSGGRYGGLDTVLVLKVEGRLLAACKLYRLEQHFTGRVLPMMGLAAVAVDPEHRERGLGAALCTAAIRTARQRGDILSVLYPFRPSYYERLGWGLVGRLLDHRFRTRCLPRYEEATHVRPASLARDSDAIIRCYERVAEAAHGPIARDARVWAYRFAGEDFGVRPLDPSTLERADADPGRVVLVFGQADVPGTADGTDAADAADVGGYALLRIRRGQDGEATAVVRELVARTEAAHRGILGYLARRSDEWQVTRYRTRPEERLEDRLSDPRPAGFRPGSSLYFPTSRMTRGPMVRLLDVPAVLAARRWFDGPGAGARHGSMRLEVLDDQVPENRGPWTVRWNGEDPDRAVVGPAGSDRPDVDIVADAAVAARLVAGDLSVSDAVRLGRCEARGDAELADRALAVRHTFWLPDEF